MPQTKERHTEYMRDYRKLQKQKLIELKELASLPHTMMTSFELKEKIMKL